MTDFPLTKFHEWLAKQPEEREFDYYDVQRCLFASFAREALGIKDACSGDFIMSLTAVRHFLIPEEMTRASAEVPVHFTIAQFRKQLEAAHVV